MFRERGLELREVPMQPDGMDVDALERLCVELRGRLKLVCVMRHTHTQIPAEPVSRRSALLWRPPPRDDVACEQCGGRAEQDHGWIEWVRRTAGWKGCTTTYLLQSILTDCWVHRTAATATGIAAFP